MASQLKQWQHALLEAVGVRITEFGFGKRPVGQSFRRKHDWGMESLHLAFVDHDVDFDVTADIAIRFDELEELIQKDNPLLITRVKRNTFSMGAELGNLVDRRPHRWTVACEVDVPQVAAEIVQFFRRIGVPYLNEYSDMRNALRALSDNGRESWLYSPIDAERTKRAAGLAWILHDERFDEIVEANTKFLAQRKDYGLDSFKAFIKSLQR